MPIKFGSDGWRRIIGADFTYENVARIALAAATWAKERSSQPVPLPIGFDTRFLSHRLAEYAARCIHSSIAGVVPMLTEHPCPSPYLAYCTHYLQVPVGIQITASHNPFFYNGVKLKGSHGGSLAAGDVREIEGLANRVDLDLPSFSEMQIATVLEGRYSEYQAAILEAVWGQEQTRSSDPFYDTTVAVDFMHGAASHYYSVPIDMVGTLHEVLRGNPDPLFGGSKPEPLEPLLPELIQRVKDAHDGTVGLAFDGDGDRLAVIDETGAYLQSHEIFALLLDFLASRGAAGGYPGRKVVTTVSFSSLLARIADSYGLTTIEVPVGFKHVSEAMLAGDVLIGGEESGGAAFGHYLPERDALLMALTLLRAKGEAGVTLHEMLRGIYARFGRSEFVHVDVPLEIAHASEFRARIPALLELKQAAGDEVLSTSDSDGVKLRTGAGWVLVRASGTEPLARFYAEAPTREKAEAYIADAGGVLL